MKMNQFRLQYTCTRKCKQGNSLCNYLKQAKMSFFFSFTKSEDRRAKQVLPGRGGGTNGRVEEVGKGGEQVDMVQIL
jgi:hypothetical protein